jgi:hypothetical protein
MITAGSNSYTTNNPDELSAYESLLFLMSVATAHEIVHFFVGFLTGYDQPSTPDFVNFLPDLFNSSYRGIPVGESGRAWEGMVFGGTLEAFEAQSPLGARQAGDLFLIDGQKLARKLDQACVKRNLEFSKQTLAAAFYVLTNSDFDFPLRTVGPAIRLRDLVDQRRTMKEVRTASLPASQPDRSRTVETRQLQFYAGLQSHTIRGREFDLLRQIPMRPAYLFAAA